MPSNTQLRPIICRAAFVLLWLLIISPFASAEDYEERKSARSWSLQITPRLWRATDNTQVFSENPFQGALQADNAFNFFGLTTVWNFDRLPATDFILTALYGEPDRDAVAVQIAGDTLRQIDIENKRERIDIEFIVRKRLEYGDTYWFAGLRYANFNDVAVQDVFEFNDGLDAAPTFSNQALLFPEENFYTGLIGVGGTMDIGNSVRHRLFANFTFRAGRMDRRVVVGDETVGRDNGFLFGPDLNVGYQLLLGERNSLSLRYRADFIRQIDRSVDDFWFITHGPEISFSTRI